jgi:uncharacterized membrane protein YjgN (DUF898 family)
MKNFFSCSVTGAHWWKSIFIFLSLFLFLFIPLEVASMKQASPDIIIPLLLFLFESFLVVLLTILHTVCILFFSRIFVQTIKLRNATFSFMGEFDLFIKVNIPKMLLSCLSLGIYLPWFIKKAADYFFFNLYYQGHNFSFFGKPGKLLKYLFLGVFVPFFVVSLAVVFAVFDSKTFSKSNLHAISFLFPILTFFFVVLSLSSCLYLSFNWFLNLTWKDIRISLKSKRLPSILFIAGQICLTFITFGIYFPAGVITSYRYFSGRIILENAGRETAWIGFDGKSLTGFIFLWGQLLLTLATFGFYAPWAIAKGLGYFMNKTYLEATQG